MSCSCPTPGPCAWLDCPRRPTRRTRRAARQWLALQDTRARTLSSVPEPYGAARIGLAALGVVVLTAAAITAIAWVVR